jgi:hypothetical protein
VVTPYRWHLFCLLACFEGGLPPPRRRGRSPRVWDRSPFGELADNTLELEYGRGVHRFLNFAEEFDVSGHEIGTAMDGALLNLRTAARRLRAVGPICRNSVINNLDRPFFLTAWHLGPLGLRWADPAVAFERPAMTWLCPLPRGSSFQSEGALWYLLTQW